MRQLGDDVWFNLGDTDLAFCVRRARRLHEGARLTEAIDEQRRALEVAARVLPMCDEPVRTYVKNEDGWHAFQEFMIREKAKGPVAGVEFRGAEAARLTPEIRAALETADTIVIGPSNPVISIGPILAVPGLRDALAARRVIAVSPLVRGQVLKGPTDAFMDWAGHPLSSDGIAAHYAGVIDGLVADEAASTIPTHVTDVELNDPASRRRVAEAVLAFA
jgi:LPPG:FO 2-phospho-L-lactate transferase